MKICCWCEGWGQSEMIFGSELNWEAIGKWWETCLLFTYQGVHLLSRWKTQSVTKVTCHRPPVSFTYLCLPMLTLTCTFHLTLGKAHVSSPS